MSIQRTMAVLLASAVLPKGRVMRELILLNSKADWNMTALATTAENDRLCFLTFSPGSGPSAAFFTIYSRQRLKMTNSHLEKVPCGP